MLDRRTGLMALTILMLSVLGLPAVLAGKEAPSLDPPPPGDPSAWVDRRVEDWQPKPAEKRFDEIGWSKDILTARMLSKDSGRPVFLFTHDGKMGTGRC